VHDVSERGDYPGGPDDGAAESRTREVLRELPWQAGMSVIVFLVFGIVELFMVPKGGGSGSGSGGQASRVSGQLGGGAVSHGPSHIGVHPIPLVVGILLLICALSVLGRQRWAQYALVVLGIVGVIDLALTQRSWQAVLAVVLLVLGTAPMFSIRAHRYLNGKMGRA
jgi:hypothetical protein